MNPLPTNHTLCTELKKNTSFTFELSFVACWSLISIPNLPVSQTNTVFCTTIYVRKTQYVIPSFSSQADIHTFQILQAHKLTVH